jgi:hypothetical protein
VSATAYDVYGDGRAIFPGFNISSAVNHAFDQLLGIQDLTVGTLDATVPAATGFNATIDAKASPTGAVLRTSGITVPTQGSFLIDRNLDLLDSGDIVLTYHATIAPTLTIGAGITVYSGGEVDPLSFEDILSPGKPALGGSDTEQTASATLIGATGGSASTTLTADASGIIEVSVRNIVLKEDDTLQVPGTLSSSGTGITISAGNINLVYASLAKGSLANAGGDGTVTVFAGGELISNELSVVPNGASIVVDKGGKITGIGSGRITFAAGPYIGVGTLTALENGAIAPTGADAVALTGSFNGTGATVLNAAVNGKTLTLTGTVILGSLTGYNGAKIGGGTVISSGASNTTVLNGATGTVTLGGGHNIAEGSLVTRGTGALYLVDGGGNADIFLTAAANDLINPTSGQIQDLTGVTFTPSTITGDLTLAGNAVLTIGAALSVNPQASATSTLDVSSGAIKLLHSVVLNLVKDPSTGGAILTNGTWTFTSQTSGTDIALYLDITPEIDAEPLDEGLYDLIGATFASTSDHASIAPKAAKITSGSSGTAGQVIITGASGAGTYNTINSTSSVLNGNS